MNKKILEQEQSTLNKTILDIDDIITDLQNELKNNESYDVILERTNRKFIKKYLQAKKNPYFARVDTFEDGKKETYYIGHSSVARDKHEDVVYSWKSSIGDLFYQFNGGNENVTVERSDGTRFDFKVLMKRSLDIERLKVKKYTDVLSELGVKKIGSEAENDLYDNFLIDILKNKKDETQLKDIILTIQKEQNEIIRLPLDKSFIVQGVAGSGKSSIALTRISYLLTRYSERIKPNDILIIAPNEMFINYIQAILPTLEIEDIPQLTFMSLSKSILKDIDINKIRVPADNFTIKNSKEIDNLVLYKGTMEFKLKIDKYIEEFEKQFIENVSSFYYFDPFTQKEIKLEQREIQFKYNDLKYLPLNRRNNETLKFVEKWVDGQLLTKQNELKKEFDGLVDVIFRGIPIESTTRKETFSMLEKIYSSKIKQMKNEVSKKWKEYKTNWFSFDLMSLYKRIIDLEYASNFPSVKNGNKSLLNFKKQLEYEDIAPILYLDIILNGTQNKVKHIVIDEAQDLSPFQLYILKEKSNSLTILGDITQSIYLNYGVSDWSTVIESVFNQDGVRLIEINTSYRSTNQVMDSANAIIKNAQLNVPKIIPIGRQGEKISLEEIYEPMKLIDYIVVSIKDIQKKGFKKVAIIHKDLEKSISLYNHLINQFSSLQLISSSKEEVKKDVIIIPSYLTKGLEFDAVIIPNASASNYTVETLDAKLFFVALTRAQHYVKIFYHREITPLLKGVDFESTTMHRNTDFSFL